MRISVPELDFRRRALALIDAVHTKNAGVVSPGSVAVPIIALGPLLLMASVITAPERFLALADRDHPRTTVVRQHFPRTAPSSPSLTGEVSSGTLGLGELNDFDLRRS